MPPMHLQFKTGSAELEPSAETSLDTLAQAMKTRGLSGYCFDIKGYTDSVGGASYNQGLSERRAESVVDYLITHEGIDREFLLAQGFGKRDPVAPNDTAKGRAQNRRVQVDNLGYGTSTK